MKKIKEKIINWFNAEDIQSEMGGNILISFWRYLSVGFIIGFIIFGIIFGF